MLSSGLWKNKSFVKKLEKLGDDNLDFPRKFALLLDGFELDEVTTCEFKGKASPKDM